MDAIVQNMFEINYSQLMQYEILEKLVTFMIRNHGSFTLLNSMVLWIIPELGFSSATCELLQCHIHMEAVADVARCDQKKIHLYI